MRMLTDLSVFSQKRSLLYSRRKYSSYYVDGEISQKEVHGLDDSYEYAVLCRYSAWQTMREAYFQRRINQNFYSLDYIVSGSLFCRYGNHAFEAEPGDAVLLHRGYDCDMLYPGGQPCSSYGFIFTGNMLAELLYGLRLEGQWCVTVREPAHFRAVCAELHGKMSTEKRRNTSKSRIAATTFFLLQELSLLAVPGGRDGMVPELRHYLEKHFQENINFQKLAHSFGMSIPTLNKRFAEQNGMTPFQYLRRYRLKNASVLLKSTRHSVKEISLESGYPSPQHFSLEFHRFFGTSPDSYRRSCRTDESPGS